MLSVCLVCLSVVCMLSVCLVVCMLSVCRLSVLLSVLFVCRLSFCLSVFLSVVCLSLSLSLSLSPSTFIHMLTLIQPFQVRLCLVTWLHNNMAIGSHSGFLLDALNLASCHVCSMECLVFQSLVYYVQTGEWRLGVGWDTFRLTCSYIR